MIIIHTTQQHLDSLPGPLQVSMLCDNTAMSSDNLDRIDIYFSDDRWHDLLSEFGADQYFDETDQGRPWMQYYAEESE